MAFENRQLKHCLRCGHRWFTRKEGSPKVCGRCRSPYWNIPKKRFVKKTETLEERMAKLKQGL